MRLEHLKSFKLRHNPCCLDKLGDEVIVGGTYELEEDCSEDWKNSRTGSLFIFTPDTVLVEHECHDGGVFDLKTMKDEKEGHEVVTAHANGRVGLYRVSLDFRTITQTNSFETGYKMLACVSVGNRKIVTGSSCGQVILMTWTGGIIQEIRDNLTQDPVWCVHLLQVTDTEDMIVSGSETASLQVFLNGKLVAKDTSGSAGITCIHVIQSHDACKTKREVISLWVGSYDENLRKYRLKYDAQTMETCLSLESVINIPGSGVWRIRSAMHGTCLVAGMYSGLHAIDTEKNEILTSKSWENKDKTTSSEDKELIYDATILSETMTTIAATSFYTKSLYIVQCQEGS